MPGPVLKLQSIVNFLAEQRTRLSLCAVFTVFLSTTSAAGAATSETGTAANPGADAAVGGEASAGGRERAAETRAEGPDEEVLDPIFRTPLQPARSSNSAPTGSDSAPTLDRDPDLTADSRLTSSPEYARLEQQIRFEEYESVLTETGQMIDALEREHGRYAPELIEALLLNGDALVGLERYNEALDQYARAVHVQRVNGGLYAPEQVTAVYREANVLKLVGELNQANDREEYAFSVLRRSYGALSPDLLPGLYHLANWYEQTANPYLARDLYRRAANIVENVYGPDSPLLVRPLDGIAHTYFRERFPPFYTPEGQAQLTPIGQTPNDPLRYYDSGRPLTVNNYSAGEQALERIVLLRSRQPDATARERSNAFLKLADWHLLFEKHRDAHRLYLEAVAVLAEESPEEAEALMRKPLLLHFPRPNSPRPPPPQLRGNKKTGYVELEFDVSERGTVTRVRGVSSNPPGLMDFKARKSIRSARYRPALLNGDLTPIAEHRYRYEFSYYETISDADPESEPVSDGQLDEPPAPDGSEASVSANSAAIEEATSAATGSASAAERVNRDA